MSPKQYENLNNLWSPITMINDVEYTPIQIHNMIGYHTPEVEQPSCEFCEWDWSARKLLRDGESNLEIIGDRLEIEYCEPSTNYKHYIIFEIKFCPMCGKRLETNQ